MQLRLRSKQGGRLEVLDENGKAIDGVLAVEIRAVAPDFVPMAKLHVLPSVVVNVEAEKVVGNDSIGGEAWPESGQIDGKLTRKALK